MAVKAFKFPNTDPTLHKNYARVHVSFQSTSSCNISTVNAVSEVKADVHKKERGQGRTKCTWGIKIKDARDLYLQTYGQIDTIDHQIQNCGLFYRTKKYWHSPMLHGKAFAIVIAYDMYLECAEGHLDELWKVDKPVDFWTFREKLSFGMLQCSPKARKYPGDAKMCIATQQNAANRASSCSLTNSSASSSVECIDNVSKAQLMDASHNTHSQKAQLVGNLDQFTKHLDSIITGKKHATICVVCGVPASASCGICKVALHPPASNRAKKNPPPAGSNCFVDYNNTHFYGLAKCDCALISGDYGKHKANYKYPNARCKQVQSPYIKRLEQEQMESASLPSDSTNQASV